MREIIGKDGQTFNEELLSKLHTWMLPAWEITNELKDQLTPLNCSLALPTWHYGHEPFTPFATHVAKYFLNSIREDVLLTLASCGIIFRRARERSKKYFRTLHKSITVITIRTTRLRLLQCCFLTASSGQIQNPG